jgi:hypothetical protein
MFNTQLLAHLHSFIAIYRFSILSLPYTDFGLTLLHYWFSLTTFLDLAFGMLTYSVL